MANALRPGDILKNKRNVNPSLDPYTEARAEDFEEVSTILEDHADKLDAMVQPEKFYGFHTSLENLIAAHPTAVENGWATIIPTNGNPPYTATYTSGVWTASVSKAPIQYYTTQTALLSTTGQEGIIYVVKDQKLLYLWYDNKFNAFGKDGANGASAYEVAVALGFNGTEQEWLDSLKGLDNYQLWLQNGNTGTYEDFFEASRGPKGNPGAGFENIPATAGQIPVTVGDGTLAWEPKPAGGGGASNIKRYLTIAAMLADQANQVDASVQYVADASTDPTVDAGYAYYEYLGTTAGTLADYRKLSEEESMDVDPGTPKASEKPISTVLLFDNPIGIFYGNLVQSGVVDFTLDELSDSCGGSYMQFTSDGVSQINFSSDFDFFYGIESGEVLPSGEYEFYFLYKPNGKVTVNVPGGTTAPTYNPGSEGMVTWKNFVNTAVSGYDLIKTVGTTGWDASANSEELILEGENKGVEFESGADSINAGKAITVGLNASSVGSSYNDIDFQIVVSAKSDSSMTTCTIFENGSVKKADALTGFALGSRFKVVVDNGVVKFYCEDTLLYTSLTVPAFPLFVDCSLYTQDSIVRNAKIITL